MKMVHALIACLLVTTTLTGCLGGDDPISGCTDSGAVNYESSADDDDGTCVLPATQEVLEAAALTQLANLEQSRTSGEAYGMLTVTTTDTNIEDDDIGTEITSIEIFDAENEAMRFTYHMTMNGMEMVYYEVRQKGDIINVNAEKEWYLVKDDQPNVEELFNAVVQQMDDDLGPSDIDFTCQNNATIPLSWVNDGANDCYDGSDEGVSQSEIDATIEAALAEDTGIINQQEFNEMDWTLEVANGYQSLVGEEEDGTLHLNFDENMNLASFTLVAKDTEALGAEFENNIITVSFLDGTELNVEVSDSYPPAASPFLIERDYDATEFGWDCEWSYDVPADQNITEDEINQAINLELENEEEFPEWCEEVFHNENQIHSFNDDDNSDYFWNHGFSTDKHSGGWDAWYEEYHTMRIEGDTLISTSLHVSEYIQSFYCEVNGMSVEIEQINDGVDDCPNGADEGLQPDMENESYLMCAELGSFTYAIYIEARDSCETTTNLSDVRMDENYLNFVLDDRLEMWYYEDHYAGEEFWFKRSNATDIGENISVVGFLQDQYGLSTSSDGLEPYAYVVEDDMKFQNNLDEFRLDLGWQSYNDETDEEEFKLRVSFDLSQMQSGSSAGAAGNDWAFTYSDKNQNNLLDAGDTFVIYTNAEDGDSWNNPKVKLYHEWGEGYTDESPAILPGFTLLGTLCLLGIAALNRRTE
ncbi:MAG: low-density lipoprotein receptor class A repeat-containing protein [Candidatus Thalassarchaeaceae archaeon]|nr:low-density lipoprotein receptor class A repeat-containing protein [Candidatus Thalassarchaeaceae archaeon]